MDGAMSTPMSTITAINRRDEGFSLLETMVGLGLLLVVAAGTLPLATVAFATSENPGHLSSRSAEYAQDKLEQLMALSWGDTTSDTRVFPAPDIGGSGLTIGGSTDPAAPVALYADYLDMQGTLIPSPNGAPPPDSNDGDGTNNWSIPAGLAGDEPESEPETDYRDDDRADVAGRMCAQTSRHGQLAQDVSVLRTL